MERPTKTSILPGLAVLACMATGIVSFLASLFTLVSAFEKAEPAWIIGSALFMLAAATAFGTVARIAFAK